MYHTKGPDMRRVPPPTIVGFAVPTLPTRAHRPAEAPDRLRGPWTRSMHALAAARDVSKPLEDIEDDFLQLRTRTMSASTQIVR